MKHSNLFMRMFGVVVIMILMTALFTTAIYQFIARNFFTQIKENELMPKAYALARVMQEYQSEQIDIAGLLGAITVDEVSDSLLGAQMVVVDREGNKVFASERLRDSTDSMVEVAQMVLSRGALRTEQIPSLRHTSMVGVGVPILRDGEVTGAILLTVTLLEAMVAMGSLNGALMLSLMLSLPMVAVILYYALGRVVRPLRQMRNVARKMASGDFSQRADVEERGEVGDLGGALNYLSERLSATIGTLVLERNRLERVINGLSEGITAVDRQMTITHANPAVAKMGLSLDRGIMDDFRQVVDGGEGISRSVELPGRVIQMAITPIHDEVDEIAGAVGLFTDITERELLERTRRDYVANVSHEMRTPLTAMRALLEPLRDGMVPNEETKTRYYSIMLRETMRLSRLIDDLMELSRLQSGTLLFNNEKISLSGIFSEIKSKYEPIAEEHQLRFTLDASLIHCPQVVCNPDRVEQVLVILLDNAIKYTPEGGNVRLYSEYDDDKVTLRVEDTGIGIGEADLPYVFDRFYKADKAHGGLGSGLGLSIASELLKLMGESIRVESKPGKGSTFSFTLKRG